jgi:hypothetical protein
MLLLIILGFVTNISWTAYLALRQNRENQSLRNAYDRLRYEFAYDLIERDKPWKHLFTQVELENMTNDRLRNMMRRKEF